MIHIVAITIISSQLPSVVYTVNSLFMTRFLIRLFSITNYSINHALISIYIENIYQNICMNQRLPKILCTFLQLFWILSEMKNVLDIQWCVCVVCFLFCVYLSNFLSSTSGPKDSFGDLMDRKSHLIDT